MTVEADDPPKEGLRDHARTVVRAAISGVPGIGGPAAELFNVVIPSSLDRRRNAWFEIVDERLDRLEQNGIDLEALGTDEGFVTIVIEATKAALVTHLEEKLVLLANCIESVALPEGRDDFLAMRFLQYVEELSPEHFIVLTYLADPYRWYEQHGITREPIMGPRRYAMDNAQLPVVGEVLELVLTDLDQRGLANVGGLGGIVSDNAVYATLSTERGIQLLKFVELFPEQ